MITDLGATARIIPTAGHPLVYGRLDEGADHTLIYYSMYDVLSARSIGAATRRIIPRHVLPNSVAVIIVYAILWIAWSIILKASLSYLGLGSQPPTPSWGNMLREGRRYMRDDPDPKLQNR